MSSCCSGRGKDDSCRIAVAYLTCAAIIFGARATTRWMLRIRLPRATMAPKISRTVGSCGGSGSAGSRDTAVGSDVIESILLLGKGVFACDLVRYSICSATGQHHAWRE